MGFATGELLAVKARIEQLVTKREAMVVANEMCKGMGSPPEFTEDDFFALATELGAVDNYVREKME